MKGYHLNQVKVGHGSCFHTKPPHNRHASCVAHPVAAEPMAHSLSAIQAEHLLHLL